MLDLLYARIPEHHPHDIKVLLALEQILANQEKIMGDLTALSAAVADNTAKVAEVTAHVAALKTATDQAGIDAAAAQLVTNNAALASLSAPSTVGVSS
jgi:hypothetical protein